MTRLQELIEAVKEENLTKTQLEQYHTEITYLDNLMRMEIAPLEKEEALYFEDMKYPKQQDFAGGMPLGKPYVVGEKRPDVEVKRMWRATPHGQRQIELSHYLKVTPKLLQSIKTRLYTIY